jgi:diacylglycerol kinase family enzyme
MRAPPVFIVLNAGSGRGDTERRRAAVQQVLEEADRQYALFVVDDARQLPAVAQRAVDLAQQQGVVVAAGGDGTINTMAQAVLRSGRPFGVLPQGTFNYFSRTYDIPADISEATRVTLTGTVQPVQVGLVNDRVFLVNASLGLCPQLLEDRESYTEHFGRSRVVAMWAGIMTLLRGYSHLVMQLEREDETQVVRTPTLVVGNNVPQLARLSITEASALQQGQLAAITLRPAGTLAMMGLLLRGALGQLGEAENVLFCF